MLCLAKADANPGLKLIERPDPKVSGEYDVLIQVGACGICGADLQIYQSNEEMMSRISPHGYPRILGHEIAGTVREVGSGVAEFREGDRVACQPAAPCGFCFYCSRGQSNICQAKDRQSVGIERDGGFAKYMIANSHQLFKLPEAIPFAEAAMLEPLGVVVHCLERSHCKGGDTVVIIGPGPLGILASMLIQANGMRTVVVAGRRTSRERLKIAAETGAQTVEIAGNNLLENIQALTAGRGADVVFDFAGGVESMNQAIQVVRPGGEIISAGLGPKVGEIDINRITMQELTVLGSRALVSSTWHRAINLAANHAIDLRRVVTHVFPLREYEKAFQLLFDRKALKICLVP